jgi:hypothetical protein
MASLTQEPVRIHMDMSVNEYHRANLALQARSQEQVLVLVRIASTGNTKTKEERVHAKRAGRESSQRMTITQKPHALHALLDFFNRLEDRITATPHVAQAQSLEQVLVLVRIASTANTKTKKGRVFAKRVGQESSQ